MLAPLIIHDERDRAGEQEVVLMLNDFSFTPPEEIFAGLKKGSNMPKMAGPAPSMAAMTRAAQAASAPDLNDVKYDAFLANDRTLGDPEVVKVEPGGPVLLRVINGSSMSNYHLQLGQLKGELIAVDGFQTEPMMASRFSIAVAQRHPACASSRARRPSGARRAGRRPTPDGHRAGRRRRGNTPHRRDHRHAVARSDA